MAKHDTNHHQLHQRLHPCQSRKNNPTKPKSPLFLISSNMYTLPFTSIALDFIVKLPLSDTFSKASIFIFCNESIDAIHIASLYATHVLPHYQPPSCIILTKTPAWFTTFVTKELCQVLAIDQNISTAYHPQTNGPDVQTSIWNNNCVSLLTITRMIGTNGYHWPSTCWMPGPMWQQRRFPSNLSWNIYHRSTKQKELQCHLC